MKKIKAFTLIETLIVIAVFCIGILTVLYWLSQTLRNKEYANTQIQAAFFAREWIEMMFNIRDANYHKELPWNCIFSNFEIPPDRQYDEEVNPFCKDKFSNDKVLKLDIWTEDNFIDIKVDNIDKIWDLSDDDVFDTLFDEYQIYKHTDKDTFLYNHIENDWEATWFARYVVIKSVGWVNSDDNLLKVESHVLYKKWIFKWEKVMETFIWNYEFNQ